MFGCLRTMVREFSCFDFVQMIEKHIRRLTVMYKNLFSPSRDPQKVYQSTFGDFFKYTCDGSVDEGISCFLVTVCKYNFTNNFALI